jgi:UDP-N-acetylmuramate dehydrogenase
MLGLVAMTTSMDQGRVWQALEQSFGARFQRAVPLARYTAARVGGPTDALLEVVSAEELAQAVLILWDAQSPFVILGGGSNVLVSDVGYRGVVVLNHARRLRFEEQSTPPQVWVESGVNFGGLARQAGQHGLAGLEWAAGIPGTVGGAIVGNAGAHGRDVASNLKVAKILHHSGKIESWPVEKLDFEYRSSSLKRNISGAAGGASNRSPAAIVLSAVLNLEHSTPEAIQSRMDTYIAHRRRTQPPGASMGSMFKNPPGDYAGRLIDTAGLKGLRIGNAEISSQHANFFINLGDAQASDLYTLIRTAQTKVLERTGVKLELEIELIGEW